MKLISLLEELEQHIENSRRIPLTGKLMVDGDHLLDYIDQIREILPEEMEESKRIYRDREKILQEARQKAEQMVEETRLHINRMVDDHELSRHAQDVGEKMVSEARHIAKEIREGANDYADDILKNLEIVIAQASESLENTAGTVRRGREELNRSRGN